MNPSSDIFKFQIHSKRMCGFSCEKNTLESSANKIKDNTLEDKWKSLIIYNKQKWTKKRPLGYTMSNIE